ncbi:putative beta-alanine synthase [Microdochium bolleyi]|uniref:Putative beta-alanine synthase n=1 Tax=Microdochium bolleyi TaxID=196109 RepID=A0A136IWB0_9PEZI|nr:putative beta-alanine synthase [Microdochium bolleyi]
MSALWKQVAGRAVPGGSKASGIAINARRLMETLHESCAWGAAYFAEDTQNDTRARSGMARLALSDEDAAVRAWLGQQVEALGCTLTTDKMGNMFARMAGSRGSGAPMTAMGSHLDTQPHGGRYDGILGIVAGLEVLRSLHERGHRPAFDIGLVNWTNEEGARFPKSMVSSAVWAGDIALADAWALPDIADPAITLGAELARHGLVGSLDCSADPARGFPLAAHFELHIEQGPVLEAARRRIGVVQGSQAYRWLTVEVAGRAAHTGTTPLEMRSDPVLAAARMITASHDVARRHGGLASTGILKLPASSSTNTIATTVSFSLDIRHPDDNVLAVIHNECLEAFEQARTNQWGKSVSLRYSLDTDSPAAKFDPGCIRAIELAADSLVGPEGWQHITSGAGHDTVCTSKQCPSAMIFVPCKGGISHHPEEYCTPQDCALGAQTLLETVLHYDQMRVAEA